LSSRSAYGNPIDAQLIELGERLEPLVAQHFDAFLQWAPLMRAAHVAVEEKFGEEWWRGEKRKAAERLLHKLVSENGCDEAQERMSALHDEIRCLCDEIKDTPAGFFGSLRAKALVVLREGQPVSSDHVGELTFPNDDDGASESLFLAVAEVTGLMPMVRGIQQQLAAQVREAVLS
jgi:hypothetical protein